MCREEEREREREARRERGCNLAVDILDSPGVSPRPARSKIFSYANESRAEYDDLANSEMFANRWRWNSRT